MVLSKLFQDEKYKPFNWAGGQPAALLVHGFPGTPAELRPLGKSLHQVGWTVEGLLLPGFGADIGTLFERQASEWVTAGEEALINLQRKHHPVLLIGYSMGAALSLQVAKACPPTALVLLAPFLQVATWWQQLIGLVLKPFFRQVRPLKKADFADPKVRHGMSNLFSSVDLDDPEVQQALRELTVPVSTFEHLFSVGHAAHRLAPEVAVPTLVVQGIEDEVVSLDKTRRLLQRLAGPLQYVEVPAGHDLIKPDQPGWAQVQKAVLAFAQNLLPEGDSAL
jgi:carboxylesterase